jgi:hypothetical protein
LTIVPFNNDCGSASMMWAGKEGWTIQYHPAPGEASDHKAPFSVTHMYWLWCFNMTSGVPSPASSGAPSAASSDIDGTRTHTDPSLCSASTACTASLDADDDDG